MSQIEKYPTHIHCGPCKGTLRVIESDDTWICQHCGAHLHKFHKNGVVRGAPHNIDERKRHPERYVDVPEPGERYRKPKATKRGR